MEPGTLNDLTVEQYLVDCVRVEPLALNEEFVRVPADLAYWGERYARALRDHLVAKIDRERTEAQVAIETRVSLEAQGGKVTEAMVSARVLLDPRLEKARIHEIDAECERARCRSACDAVSAKREMIVSLGAQVRKEMDNDPMVRAAHANAHASR